MDKYTEAAIGTFIYIGGSIYNFGKNIIAKKEKRILVTRIDAIGDMVYTIPFLRGLRHNYPEHKITLVCHPSVKNMIELSPYFDELLTFDNRVYRKRFLTHIKRSYAFIKEYLWGRNYDLAILPNFEDTGSWPEMFMALFSGARQRVAYAEDTYSEKKEAFFGFHDMFFTKLCHRVCTHEVESTLNLLGFMGMPYTDDSLELWTDKHDQMVIDKLFAEHGLCSKFQQGQTVNIIVNLSTSNKSKDWAVEKYIEVCKKLQEKYALQFLLIGAGDTAVEYAEQFITAVPEAHNFANMTTIRQTIEIIRRSQIYLGGDTGPMHFAAVYGLSGVAIYKNSKHIQKEHKNYEWYAPWKSKILIVQPEQNLPGCEYECGKDGHCINQVTTQQVCDALEPCLLELLI